MTTIKNLVFFTVFIAMGCATGSAAINKKELQIEKITKSEPKCDFEKDLIAESILVIGDKRAEEYRNNYPGCENPKFLGFNAIYVNSLPEDVENNVYSIIMLNGIDAIVIILGNEEINRCKKIHKEVYSYIDSAIISIAEYVSYQPVRIKIYIVMPTVDYELERRCTEAEFNLLERVNIVRRAIYRRIKSRLPGNNNIEIIDIDTGQKITPDDYREFWERILG